MPISIVIAGLIIGGVIFYTHRNNPNGNEAAVGSNQEFTGPRAIANEDHLLGNPDAGLTLIVFTDLECPWCKKFHQVIRQIIEDYAKTGKLKIVFRHFPLDSIHKKAEKEAEASECAGTLGGNDKFWEYVNKVFEITPSSDGLDPAQLPKIAQNIGLDINKFTECLNSGKFKDRVQADYQDAANAGANGTPFSVLINSAGEKFPLNGFLTYQQLKAVLDQFVK